VRKFHCEVVVEVEFKIATFALGRSTDPRIIKSNEEFRDSDFFFVKIKGDCENFDKELASSESVKSDG